MAEDLNEKLHRIADRSRNPLAILCLDFDGVLHGYQSGWQGAAIIPDPPVPGAVEFLHGAVKRFRVAVYSSRSGQPGGLDAMRGWLTMHVMATIEDRGEAAHVLGLIEWPTEKPPALVTIDDRAITFTGAWPSLDEIAAFKTWNKRPAEPGREAWCFDMEAAPRDKTPVLLTVPTIHDGCAPIVGEAYFDPERYGGSWWWAGTGWDDYHASPLSETNEPPIAWRHMPAPAVPASPRSGAGEGEETKIDGKLYANVSTQPFRCPECWCLTYARTHERNADGDYRPSLLIRCVGCKSVYRDANAVELDPPAPAEHGVEIREAAGTDALLASLRAAGWAVAVHNDYRLAGEARTFWLFTHSDGRWIKGEGRTDDEAIREALSAAPGLSALSQGDAAGRSERAVEIRDLVGRARLQAASERAIYGDDAGELYDELADAIVSALSQADAAGRSERAAEIRELSEKAFRKGWRANLPSDTADDPATIAFIADLEQEAWDASQAKASLAAPAQSPSTSDGEG